MMIFDYYEKVNRRKRETKIWEVSFISLLLSVLSATTYDCS